MVGAPRDRRGSFTLDSFVVCKLFKKRASLAGEIVENSVKLVFLTRQRRDRQVAAVIREDHCDAFARFDDALDEHHFTGLYAYPPRDETADQHLDRFFRGSTSARGAPVAVVRIGAHFWWGYRLSGGEGGIIVPL